MVKPAHVSLQGGIGWYVGKKGAHRWLFRWTARACRHWSTKGNPRSGQLFSCKLATSGLKIPKEDDAVH